MVKVVTLKYVDTVSAHIKFIPGNRIECEQLAKSQLQKRSQLELELRDSELKVRR